MNRKKSKQVKCKCGAEVIGIEYSWDDPHHYDGISEWQCSKCERRWGRWTGKEITKDNPFEPRYGLPAKSHLK